jgi:nucleotide-binding universal stress UspA family protein
MFHTIVLALDGSDGADRAIPTATALAARDNARVIVAHAETRALETDINARLTQQINVLRTAGIDAEVMIANSVIVGREADAIAQIAHDCDADMIVIAGRGRSPFVGAVLGSVTQRLLHVADRPVLVVPPGETAMQEREPSQDTATAVS